MVDDIARENKFPTVEDLRLRARRRIPHFAWEYLDSGTGADRVMAANRAALDHVRFRSRVLRGKLAPELGVTLLGRHYDLPFGIAPVGATGLMWPGTEQALAKMAARERMPYTLSTVATRVPEEIGPLAGGFGWFQLYTPGRDEVRQDIMRRIREAGFTTLVLTVDVPLSSRRERQRRAGLRMPPTMSPRMLWQMLQCPEWCARTLKNGVPRFRTLEAYIEATKLADVTRRLAEDLHSQPDWSIVARVKEEWGGPLILKGIHNGADAVLAREAGADAIWVSNHGGRQLDAVPGCAETLQEVRRAVGDDFPLLFDSGIRSGLDIVRALALGADFCMLGRAFIYGAGALGVDGVSHVTSILRDDLVNAMGQIGVNKLADLPAALWDAKKE